jgi:4-alpha-glucanotransferase
VGVLLPIAALPSHYGIGDLGPEARRFARLLNLGSQRYWQMLPLNPISAGAGFSPYSSISTMACNPLLISPDLMEVDGLLTKRELRQFHLASGSSVDYEAAGRSKTALLDKAFERYKSGSFRSLKLEVAEYSFKEASWLDDFALYVVISRHQDGKPWYLWPEDLRRRDKEALIQFAQSHIVEIEKVEWQQAMFSRQWQCLRGYCGMLGVRLIGDLPFYASYDSADVWTHPEIFSVDEDSRMTGVAGVPPDYFSRTGQLWGMPTFKWDVLRKQGYRWWIDRLRKNLELYDMLRIDHFRALAAYWQVPAGEETAVNGEWIPGPGTHFFDAVKGAFGGLPFVAEDLGDNMADVYRLRDEVGLPGMKVLQFAFGDNLPTSVDAPHNYDRSCVVYTGTHDNNTTLGWYRKETGEDDRRRLARYAGSAVAEENVHEVMARLAYGSVGRIAILPMQDILGLDERARMNVPSSGAGNWRWRMKRGQLKDAHLGWLREMAHFYNRV